jgi:hypothetical protein
MPFVPSGGASEASGASMSSGLTMQMHFGVLVEAFAWPGLSSRLVVLRSAERRPLLFVSLTERPG